MSEGITTIIPAIDGVSGAAAQVPIAIPSASVTTTISRVAQVGTQDSSVTATPPTTLTPLISITPTPIPMPTSYTTLDPLALTTTNISSEPATTKSLTSRFSIPSSSASVSSDGGQTTTAAVPTSGAADPQQANGGEQFKSKAAPILGALGAFAGLMILGFALLNMRQRRQKRQPEGRDILPKTDASATRRIGKPDVEREDSFLRLYMRSGMSRLNSVSFSNARPAPPPPSAFAGLLGRRDKAMDTLKKAKGKEVLADEKGIMTAQADAMRGSAPDWRQKGAPVFYPFAVPFILKDKRAAEDADIARAY